MEFIRRDRLQVVWFIAIMFTVNYVSLIPSEEFLLMPGDVIIGGLFQVAGCPGEYVHSSLQNMEAVRWFLKGLNQRNYVPGIKLGFHAYQTCGQHDIAMRRTIDLLEYYTKNKNTPLLGLIGPELSAEVMNVSRFLSSLPARDMLLQLSPTATAAALVNPVKYKNLFHFIPSDNIQVEVIIQLMLKLKWNYIDIIFENGVYGKHGAQALLALAKKNNICVAGTYSLPFEADNYRAIDDFLNGIKVRGVVFFGRPKTAQNLLVRLEQRRDSHDIIPDIEFIFSETLSMSTQSFKDVSGGIINAAKGSLIASPPYRNISSFSEHWKEMYTSASVENLPVKNYFDLAKSCNPSAQTDCDSERIMEQSLYVQFSLHAAASMAETIKRTHHNVCGGKSGMCDLLKNINRADLITNMVAIHMDVKDEFPNMFKDYDGVTFSFRNDTRELQCGISNTRSTYEVLNFVRCGSDFCFQKVAEFRNGNLNVSTSELHAYTTLGEEITEVTYPIAQCPVDPGDCTRDCLSRDLDDQVIYIPGDVYIIGLIPIYRQDGSDALKCGMFKDKISVDLAESFIFALENVNRKLTHFSIAMSKKVGLVVLNTCNSKTVVKEKILRLQSGRMQLSNGVNSSSIVNNIIGYVGALGSSISIAAAEILTQVDQVQISFSSTNPSLSNRKVYPYFMRTCTPDQKQALAIIDIVKRLKSTYIQIVHSNEAYGRGGKDILEKTAKENGVCVAKSIEISDVVSEGIHNNVINELWKNRDAKVVIIFVRSDLIEKVITAISKPMESDEFFFIGSETWGRRPAMLSLSKLRGRAISLAQDLPSDFGFDEYMMRKTEASFMHSENPWLARFIEERGHCYLPLSFSKKDKHPCTETDIECALPVKERREPWVPFVIASVYSLIHGYDSVLQGKCSNNVPCSAATLYQEIIDQSEMDWFNIGKNVRLILESGDGNVGYNILHLNNDMVYEQVGRWTDTDFTFHESKVSTLSTLNTACPNEVQCERCKHFLEKPQSTGSSGLSIGVITGMCAEAFVILLLGVGCILLLCRRRVKPDEHLQQNTDCVMPDYITPVNTQMSFKNRVCRDDDQCWRESDYAHISDELREDPLPGPPSCCTFINNGCDKETEPNEIIL